MANPEPANTPHQLTEGRPGETAAYIIGVKRTISNASVSSESEDVLKPCGKRPRQIIEGTLELHELYSYVGDKSYNEQLKPVIDDHPSEEDVQFMKHAESVSLNSPDESTKVGAIIVDKTKKVIGKGWNRMPKGCEDRFAMSKGDTDILKTKYPYVLHGVRAAILDALKKNPADKLEGATLYCTLIPDHNDSQMIREVGIERAVYRDDKFPDYAFTIASKRILEGLDCVKIVMPTPGTIKPTSTDSDTDPSD